jgi:DNA polymerase-3 subunit epsilon
MKYLSIDIEATGTHSHCQMIEFAAVPFDSSNHTIYHEEAFHRYLFVPAWDKISPTLDPWIIEHMKDVLIKAHEEGIPLERFQKDFHRQLQSPSWKQLFGTEKITLFGKSLNALDIPFLKRDLGDQFFDLHFSHKVLDVTSVAFLRIDEGLLPKDHHGSRSLMNYFKMGQVCHTALEDATNTIHLYFQLLKMGRG